MTSPPLSDKLVRWHGQLDDYETARLRALSARQRGNLIVSACKAAAMIGQGRRASGLHDASPAPWPASTWVFLKEHAARVRT